jgi:hypothetical protein
MKLKSLLEAQAAKFVVIKVGFQNIEDEDGHGFFVINADSDAEAKEVVEHANEVDWNELSDSLDHMCQNVTGEHIIDGSAYTEEAKIVTKEPSGMKYFSLDLGDFMAA